MVTSVLVFCWTSRMMRVPFRVVSKVVGVEIVVIAHSLTGVAADEKNITDMLLLSGQWHFVEGLQFLLCEINLDSLVAVFNLLLDNECYRTLVIVYAVNECRVDKSLQICQMFVDNFCHVTVLLQIVDVARHKRTVYVCPSELVQRVEAFINTNKTFPCLAGAGGIVVTANLSRPALDVIDKLNEERPDKAVLLILDTFLFLGFLAGFFFAASRLAIALRSASAASSIARRSASTFSGSEI